MIYGHIRGKLGGWGCGIIGMKMGRLARDCLHIFGLRPFLWALTESLAAMYDEYDLGMTCHINKQRTTLSSITQSKFGDGVDGVDGVAMEI